jgi:hypothetical protein
MRAQRRTSGELHWGIVRRSILIILIILIWWSVGWFCYRKTPDSGDSMPNPDSVSRFRKVIIAWY